MEIPELLLSTFEIDEGQLSGIAGNEEKFSAFRNLLESKVDYLLRHDLIRLKGILYRIDIDEKKLGNRLTNSDEDAARVITDMIIERQFQKAESRKKFGGGQNDWNFDV